MESPYLTTGVAICCAVFWYRGALFENVPPWRWVLPSLLVSFGFPALARGDWGWVLVGNAVLFVGITVWRAFKDERDARR